MPKNDLPLANDITALAIDLADIDRAESWVRQQVTDSRIPATDGAIWLEACAVKRRYLAMRQKLFLADWAREA